MSEEVKELEWGKTVWDDLSRDELLREVQRMFSAIVSMKSVLGMVAYGREDDLYWSKTGVGGNALEMARQATSRSEGISMFGGFFRYADDLLFDPGDFAMIGFGWAVCDECGTMLGGEKRNSLVGQQCPMCKAGVMRKIEWKDLDPALGK